MDEANAVPLDVTLNGALNGDLAPFGRMVGETFDAILFVKETTASHVRPLTSANGE